MKSLIKYNFLFSYINKVNYFPLSSFRQSLRKYSKKEFESTLNDKELSHFRTLSTTIDWQKDPQFEGLRTMNELRVPFIRDSFKSSAVPSKPLDGIKLLEIGCGPGLLTTPLARLGADVTAIDPVQESIEIAINLSQNDKEIKDNLKYESVSIEDFSSREETTEYFDGVIASEVLEHIDDINLFLSSGLKCLKKGGNLFITTENQTPLALFAAIFLGEYVLNLVPKGTHRYNQFVNPSALKLILEDHNCFVTLIHGMAYNPLTGRWFWTQNQSINYALKAIKV